MSLVPSSLHDKRLHGLIAAAPFDAALEKLAYTNEIKVAKTSDGFYLFQPLEESEELYVNGDHNTAVRRAFKPTTNNAGGAAGLFVKLVNGQKLISADAVNASLTDLVKQASQGNQ